MYTEPLSPTKLNLKLIELHQDSEELNQENNPTIEVSDLICTDVHSVVQKFIQLNPPLEILPKSLNLPEDSIYFGSNIRLLKLIKFRGRDYGKSKMSKDDLFERFEFDPSISTLQQIFTPV